MTRSSLLIPIMNEYSLAPWLTIEMLMPFSARAAVALASIPAENAMALGDSGNDESILRAAGLGVAMGNAPDFIKAAADVVTEPHDRDGAAIAIEKYCL